MNKTLNAGNTCSGIFAVVLFAIGLLNVFLVHPVPGIIYLLLSFLYFPPANSILRKRFGFSIPLVVKIILGIVIIMFTLGVSDLGDMIDKL
jgi:succinate dehydrogenase/fumarate reductase cytochrome b subunit